MKHHDGHPEDSGESGPMSEETASSGETVATVASLAGFLEAVDALDRGDGLVVYRGRRQGWPLRPSVGRFETPSEEIEEARIRLDERRLLREFSNRARPYLESALSGPALHRLMVAQHYGVPTRLLDWSQLSQTGI